jgi:hypothetical protein
LLNCAFKTVVNNCYLFIHFSRHELENTIIVFLGHVFHVNDLFNRLVNLFIKIILLFTLDN